MKPFYVIVWDFNKDTAQYYDIMLYLINKYEEYRPKKNKPKTFEEFKDFIINNSLYKWWSRCEYEIIITEFPKREKELKTDIHQQVMMNIDVITNLFINNINENNRSKCREYNSK